MHVSGSGPLPADWCIVGEGPGWQEDKAGKPFVDKMGEELTALLTKHPELPNREDCFLTNVFREYRGKDYTFTAADLACDEPELLDELQRCQPRVIVPLGRYATRWFLGDVDMDEVWGLPWYLPRIRQDQITPMPHIWNKHNPKCPASARYVGRPTKWGNPYSHLSYATIDPKCVVATREEAIRRFQADLSRNPDLQKQSRRELRGHDLSCWCAPQPCHARIWRDLANAIVVFPIHHPASGFHNPEMSPYVVAGFERWAEYEAGKVEPRHLYTDPLKGKEQYEEITAAQTLEQIGQQWTTNTNIAIDTEGWPDNPWSLQFSHLPGVSYLIRATRRDLLCAFAAVLSRTRPRLTFHNALHDLAMGRALGVPFDGLAFDDTMVMAYLLQLEPQGLKALCVRHCNMFMSSYDELTAEPSQRLAVDWLTCLFDMEQEDYENRCKDELAARQAAGRRCKVAPKLPKTALHKAVTRCLQSKDARRLWDDQLEDIQMCGYARLGAIPKPTLDYVPRSEATHYGCRDADGTIRVRSELEPRINALGLQGVYDLELGTYPLLDRMQRIGIKPDLGHFARLSNQLGGAIQHLRDTLAVATGAPDFNANSGDQVAAYLFDELNLQGMKRTSNGRYSTNDKILEALEREHGTDFPAISDIRLYRETYKLKHTFVDRLPDFVRRWPFDGRIHASFRTTRVVTGRLAASDPNLLAMPKHGKFANDFRRGWVPEPGHLLCEWDLSQIELRVLAHLSQDPVLLEAFRGGRDLHAGLAQRIFGGTLADHKKGLTRLAAKAVNFGIPMGMTAVGLSVELRKNGVAADEDDAQRWLDETMALYHQVPVYQDQKVAEAARNGFVRCLSGRIRYIGGIRSRDEYTREEAKRFAFSTPIQEGAQLICKQAEVRLYQDILVPYWQQGRWVEPLLQVHDALLLECEDDPELAHDLNDKMQATMTQAPDWFTVPIETSGDWGYNWADMESF